MTTVITANDLRSGLVVYLGPAARWVRELGHAVVAGDRNALELLEADARQAVERTEVTGVYAMPVRLTNDRIEPVSVRERLRAAHAPSI